VELRYAALVLRYAVIVCLYTSADHQYCPIVFRKHRGGGAEDMGEPEGCNKMLTTRLKQMQYCRMHFDRLHLQSRDASRSVAGRIASNSRPLPASLARAGDTATATCSATAGARLTASESLNACSPQITVGGDWERARCRITCSSQLDRNDVRATGRGGLHAATAVGRSAEGRSGERREERAAAARRGRARGKSSSRGWLSAATSSEALQLL
jgi:hypothetical protein